jgi:4,4'-diaponeurosporenoate glycosyltransferase
MIAVEVFGVDHSASELAVFAAGWTIGWLLLWRRRELPRRHISTEQPESAHLQRPAVAVVIPARDEAASLPHLLPPLMDQARPGDRVVVVDDHSTDATADIARAHGADVLDAPQLQPGWRGKPNACWFGATETDQPILVFLDADVRPGPTLLDDLASRVAQRPSAVVSMQPWHRMDTLAEQPSILCNVTALMGCGAFTVAGERAAATVAFGPVIAVDRDAYLRAGGHACPDVRSRHTEDIALARAVGESDLFMGRPGETTFRMYPGGLADLVRGWGRSLATGARFTPWWLALATAAWIASLAGGWIAAPLVYPLSAIQVAVLGRRAGTIRPAAAVLYPVLVVCFSIIFVRSAFAVVFGRQVTWKGRGVETRPG